MYFSFTEKGFSILRFLMAGAIVLSIFVIVSPMNSQSPAKWKGTVKKEGDVTIVHNPKEPLYKGETLTLKEEMAIGGAAAKEPYSLAVVRSLAVEADAEDFPVVKRYAVTWSLK